MPWYVFVAAVLVGFASGVLSGMFGIGGAVLTTPGIRVLGATPIEGVGSTVPAILPGAISGTVRYAKAGIVNWRVGLVCGITGSALAVAGAWVADLANAHLLMVLTALLLAWSGITTWRSGRSTQDEELLADVEVSEEAGAGPAFEPEADDRSPVAAPSRTAAATLPALAAVGAAAGFLAGLLGVGGGVVMMPAFTLVLRIPIKEAVASSLVAVAIFSIPALVTHALLGHIHWGFALALIIGVVPGAQIGSRLTIGTSDRVVRSMFGAFLVVLAFVYGTSELLAWLRS